MPSDSIPDHLNHECFCITLDREALCRALEREAGDDHFCETFIGPRPHLFSNFPLFISKSDVADMLLVVRAIEAAAHLPAYQKAALAWAPEVARHDFGPRGVFMGYDFHLANDGPKLIEVNTNAGGAFLNALLAKAQHACCPEIEVAMAKSGAEDFEADVIGMFGNEWKLQRRDGRPERVAIVDEKPTEQYLYPEFLLARRLFERHGIEAVVADVAELRYENGVLLAEGRKIDLVYNRLVDFALGQPGHAALRQAWLDGAVVVTPNPRIHALFADKRNLALLSDGEALARLGLAPDHVAVLARNPRTVLVVPENAAELWGKRKSLFFKPAGGYGGKAVYRGDKVTKSVWSEIIRGGYIAQEFASPGERLIKLDGAIETRKVDVRLFIYDGKILLTAARIYQGQTTNFRTPGGGFAPVFAM